MGYPFFRLGTTPSEGGGDSYVAVLLDRRNTLPLLVVVALFGACWGAIVRYFSPPLWLSLPIASLIVIGSPPIVARVNAQFRRYIEGLAGYLLVPVGIAAAILFLGWLVSFSSAEHTYSTEVGEVRSVVLPEGSIVGLNTQTELEWVGSRHDRRVRLIRGEAYFQVVHDPSRPFRILLAHSQVQVLGTSFDVYQMANGDVRVSVISGMVAVEASDDGQSTPSWSRRLTAGQQIEYSPVGLVADVHSIVAPKVIRWREGMLETQGEPLKDFVSDISRYTTERIVIADPRAADQKVAGQFKIGDVRGTLDRLKRIAPITVTEENGEYIVGYRPQPQSPHQ